MAIDPNSLPKDAETLQKIVVDLAEQLDRAAEQNKYQSLLRELLDAQRNRKSEQLSKDQLALFEALWKARSRKTNPPPKSDDDDFDGDAGAAAKPNDNAQQEAQRAAASGAASGARTHRARSGGSGKALRTAAAKICI